MLKNFKKDRCYIIAEIGGNFTTFEEAKKLVDLAYESGVDAVKLQTYKADTIVTKSAKFDLDNVGEMNQYELFEKYQIDFALHKKVFDYIDSKGLEWLSTPSHKTDVDMLDELGVRSHKIGADDATNLPLIKYVAQTGKPILLSSGMCTIEEVREMINTCLEVGNDKIILFHTVSNYPTYPEQVNLKAMQTLKKEFPYLKIGFSDHTIGSTACFAAACMGAEVVEKHFTYDKNADGPDHQLSANPKEMKEIVDKIREFETMKGSGAKKPVGKEITNREKNRKSIVAIKPIKKGEVFTLENIDIKRPGHGIAPKYFEEILGKYAKEDIEDDKVLNWSDIS
ncbi:N-acetylneuraminate synthase family protein [Aliarcobacter butzleri]|uniref:N-acetylneuraminate synthase family protein n=1 Tax=Aliarcobacter butzleri TaxID=28197 RepID=UPI0021B32A3A|nr:N-acetylneuraminate synthase family protein [Aliarcobacter butzleri]MCT7605867.1 N-acetylneuraminate synthase family protein [Aliarcobacter butzleri]MCT7608130.1 N-acetylneuraminate synthase family protein [Aliarcobacter butzleri]